MGIKIKVEPKHIADGKAGSCTKCPIALAIRDLGLFPAGASVAEDHRPWVEYVNAEGKMMRRCLPETAMKFVRDFDEGSMASPVEFELGDEELLTCKCDDDDENGYLRCRVHGY